MKSGAKCTVNFEDILKVLVEIDLLIKGQVLTKSILIPQAVLDIKSVCIRRVPKTGERGKTGFEKSSKW